MRKAILLLVLAGFQSLFAQSVSLAIGSASAQPGSTVSLPITMTASGGAQPTALQWTFAFAPAASVSGFTIAAGPAATAASKQVTCSGNTCLVFGLNATVLGSGTVATVSLSIPASASGTVQVSLTNAVVSDPSGGLTSSGGSGVITISTPPPAAALNTLSCASGSIQTPGTLGCTVNLTAAAPAGGFAVALSSNQSSLTVPTSVSVAASQSSATFTATAAQVTSDQTATITAAASGVTRTAGVSLLASPALASLSCAAGSLTSGQSTTCTASLTKASIGTTTVSLSDNTAQLTTPASVTLANGQTSVSFTATAGTISSGQVAVVTATSNGISKTAQISLTAPATLTSLSCAPNTFSAAGAATCTVALSGSTAAAAPVSLSSDSANVTVPGSVTVQAGQSSASFTATVKGVPADIAVVVTAALNGVTRTDTIALTSLPTLTSITCAVSSLSSNQSTTCTALLSKAAVSATVVNLTDDTAQLLTPASVSIGSGQTSATFGVTAGSVASSQSATITGALNGVSRTVQINLVAAALSQLSCTPTSFGAAGAATCTVTLAAPAGVSTSVSLSSNNGSVTVPASLTVLGGQSSANFTATIASFAVDSNVTITASLNGGTRTATIALTTPPGLSGLSCVASSLGSNQSTTCTATLTKAAAGSTTISLSDNSNGLSTPSSVPIASGQTSGTFSVSTGLVTASQTATITAALNGVMRTAQISLVAPAGVSGLSCSPNSFTASGTSTCTVTLAATVSSDAVLTLVDNSANVSVPGTVTVLAGQSSAQFSATVSGVPVDETVTISASYGGGSQMASLVLSPAATLSGLACDSLSLSAGQSANCTVTLSKASTGPAVVALSSGSVLLTVPANVTVGTGQASATFSAVAASTIPKGQGVTLTANLNGVVRTVQVNLKAAQGLGGFVCTPGSVSSGHSALCQVSLLGPAQQSTVITLTSDNDSIAIPASVVIPAGEAVGQFRANVPDGVTGEVKLTATEGVNSANASITVEAVTPDLLSLNCSPSSLTVGQVALCVVTLNQPPASPLQVAIASDNPSLTVPSHVTVSGSASATFSAVAGSFDAGQSVQVSASAGGKLVSSAIQLSVAAEQPGLKSFTCAPSALPAGTSGLCTVTFTGRITTAENVGITASSGLLGIPSQLVPPAGALSASFSIRAGGTETEQPVTISLTWPGSAPLSQTIVVTPVGPLSIDAPPAVFTRAGTAVSFEVKAIKALAPGTSIIADPATMPDGATFSNQRFSWRPDASAVGEHPVTVRLVNSSGTLQTLLVRVVVRAAEALVENLVNPAGFTPSEECSANSIMTLLGHGFSLNDPLSADEFPLPTALGGVRVKTNGDYVPLLYVSDELIHFQCPVLPVNEAIEIVLEYQPASSSPGNAAVATTVIVVTPVKAKMSSANPGIYVLSGKQGAVVHHPTGKVAGPPTDAYPTHPAAPGEYVIIYGNGMGPGTLSLAPGEPAPLDTLVYSTALVSVDFGNDIKVPAAFAGLAPGSVGLFQVNVIVPSGIATGPNTPVTLEMTLADGTVLRSNTVTIATN